MYMIVIVGAVTEFYWRTLRYRKYSSTLSSR